MYQCTIHCIHNYVISYTVVALCFTETVKSALPGGSQGRRMFNSPRRLVFDEPAKTTYNVRAVSVPSPPSRSTSRAPATVGKSMRLAENSRIYAPSLRTPRNRSSLMTYDVSRHCHGVMNSAAAEADVSGKQGDKLDLTTTNDTALKNRASSGAVCIHTNSERQPRCNGRITTLARPQQTSSTDNKRSANVKVKEKKIKRIKSDGSLCNALVF